MMTATSTRRLLAALLALGACREQPPFHGTVISDPLPAPALRVHDSRGNLFDLSAEKGQSVLVYFGYTHCPDVCPTTLTDFARARRSLGVKQRESMRFVFVSVDPGRDTPTITEAYVRQFDPAFVGLAPTPGQLDSIKTAWGFAVERDSMTGMRHDKYGVSHPAGVFAIDKEGKVRLVIAPATKPDELVADLKRLP